MKNDRFDTYFLKEIEGLRLCSPRVQSYEFRLVSHRLKDEPERFKLQIARLEPVAGEVETHLADIARAREAFEEAWLLSTMPVGEEWMQANGESQVAQRTDVGIRFDERRR